MCNEFDVNTMSFGIREMSQMNLNDNWLNLFNNLAIENRYGVAVAVLNMASVSELDLVYNKLKNQDYNNQNDQLFLETEYFNHKFDFNLALLTLNSIVTNNDNEADLKAIMIIQLQLRKNKKGHW